MQRSRSALAGERVDRFAGAKGVSDIAALRKALDLAEAWPFTTRPLDLAETVEFWLTNGRVGSRLELLRASIDKRIEERDQDRADAKPISKERIRQGARLDGRFWSFRHQRRTIEIGAQSGRTPYADGQKGPSLVA
jgi:hypothetical protein